MLLFPPISLSLSYPFPSHWVREMGWTERERGWKKGNGRGKGNGGEEVRAGDD